MSLLLSSICAPTSAALHDNFSTDPKLLKVTYTEQQGNNLFWTATINPNSTYIDENSNNFYDFKLSLSGSHTLDENSLKAELSKYDINYSKTSVPNTIILHIPETIELTTLNLKTIDDEKNADNLLKVSGKLNQNVVEASDIQRHYRDIAVNFIFDEAILNDSPFVTVKLLNNVTKEIISEKTNATLSEVIQFNNLRMYDDFNHKIDYALEIDAPDDYEVVEDDFTVSITKNVVEETEDEALPEEELDEDSEDGEDPEESEKPEVEVDTAVDEPEEDIVDDSKEESEADIEEMPRIDSKKETDTKERSVVFKQPKVSADNGISILNSQAGYWSSKSVASFSVFLVGTIDFSLNSYFYLGH